MKHYWPILFLRLMMAIVFFYFGYLALVHPVGQLAYISPRLLAMSPLPGQTLIFIIGLLEVAVGTAFTLGVWLDVAGFGAAALLLGIIISLADSTGYLNELGIRDQGLLAACLVIATADHRLALSPSVRRIKIVRLAVYVVILLVVLAWMLR